MKRLAFLLMSLLVCNAAPAQGTTYPDQPIKLLVPYSAGGAADVAARLVSEKAAKLLGQPIVIENRPGAGGSIAAGVVANAAPDGYTLLLTSVAIPAINPHLMHLNFDPIKQLSTFAVVATFYTALVVPAKSPFKTVGDLVAYGKAHPGKLSFGSSGNGSITHLTAELFTAAAGIKALHVPYKGNPQVIQDLLSGNLDFTFDGAWKQNSAGGLVRVLAYTGPKRSPLMPDVPTLVEAGVKNYSGFEPWIGFATSALTPKPILDKLSAAFLQAARDPDVDARLLDQGFELRNLGPGQVAAMIVRDNRLLGKLIRSQGIKP